jgi:hypothetical protein
MGYVIKVLCLIALFGVTRCIKGLYRVFVKTQREDKANGRNDAGYVAIGLLIEVIFLLWVIGKLVVV